MLGESFLHRPIFQGVIADDRDATAGIQPPNGGIETSTEHGKLAVHFDTKRLERSLGGMPASATRLSGNGRFNNVHEFARRFDGMALAALHNELRNATRPLLVGVVANDPGELCCG